MEELIQLQSPTLKFNGVCIDNPDRVVIPRGITAVIGDNGAGKSSLARILENGWNYMTNEIASADGRKLRIRQLAFSDIHSLSGFKTEYYQQRYESTMNDETPTVSDLFGEKTQSDLWREATGRLGLSGVLDKRLNFLSSGELRKLLIVNALFDLPDLLILDNPYIGLDASSRPAVDETLRYITERGSSAMVLVCDLCDIPPCADMVLGMRSMTLLALPDAERQVTTERHGDAKADPGKVFQLLPEVGCGVGRPVIEMRGCTVKYGPYVLLDNVDWRVSGGDFWALTGPNGSGKSTLLSLVNADNPQAYSNDISLFGRRRGTGESIWDIKRRIGFLSSELHLYFNGRVDTLRQVVGGGLSQFDRVASDTNSGEIDRWLDAFGLIYLADHRFNTLSTGEQRLALFVRALVKRPELLILDEPMHGIDAPTKKVMRRVIKELSQRGVTIIFVTHCPEELPDIQNTKYKALSVNYKL